MKPDLDDFESAFDAPQSPLQPELAWRRVERAVRRRMRGPTLDLLTALLMLIACVAGGLYGSMSGWGIAGFFALVVLPGRWKARREWLKQVAAVESAESIRALCQEQAKARAAGALASFLVLSLLAVVFFATALVAYAVGKSPWPGAVAALVVFAWAVFKLLVRLPLAARELAILDVDE